MRRILEDERLQIRVAVVLLCLVAFGYIGMLRLEARLDAELQAAGIDISRMMEGK